MPEKQEVRVCFLVGTLGRGGAERQLVYMLRALQGIGVSLRVICLTRGEAFEKEIRELGISIEWIGASGQRLVRLYNIIQSLRREPADILQSSHFYTNMYAGLAARALGIKSIGAIRNDLVSEIKENRPLGKVHLKLPGHLIANTALARRRAIEQGISSERIDYVPNVVDTARFRQSAYRNGNHDVCILFAGRLTEAKRPDRFLRVFLRTIQDLPNHPVNALVAGDGPLRHQLEEAARAHGLGPDRFELLGEQSDMTNVYRRADMLMLTSDWEGTPNVLLEAMACGLPVVATRVGGVCDIVTEGSGFVTEPCNEDGLVDATRRLVSDVGLRAALGRGGHEYVGRNHSLKALQRQLLDIYQRVLSR